MPAAAQTTLRDKQVTATREHLLEAAFTLLVEHPDRPFSHEAVAKAARVGARTVYRYFPTQADLFEALWVRVRQQAGTIFPDAEEQILPQITVLFLGFDKNEKLIRAVLESPAGHRVRERGAEEGRTCFTRALSELTRGRSAAERRQIMAVFLGIYSAPFWQLLRERGGLSGPEAIAAATWATRTLLGALRHETKITRRPS
jgi:AcrR family transcriptional regulator